MCKSVLIDQISFDVDTSLDENPVTLAVVQICAIQCHKEAPVLYRDSVSLYQISTDQ